MALSAIKIPVIVSAYNRPHSLNRILTSLERARYPREDVPLFISLDAGGPGGTKEVAEQFHWSHGTKKVVVHNSQLGMRDHAFACMDLLGEWEYVIFLEDDSVVGRDFYSFSSEASKAMSRCGDVFATSLYSFDVCEFDGLRFAPIQTEQSVFFMKSATTWGVVFSREWWWSFRRWYQVAECENDGSSHIPTSVNQWPQTSWKKFINRFLSKKSIYFMYPYNSHLSHFADPGTHFDHSSSNYQVPMETNLRAPEQYLKVSANSVVRYDEFWELIPPNELIEAVGVEFEFDLRRLKEIQQYRTLCVLTTRPVKNSIATFGGELFPLEANILATFEGNRLSLAYAQDVLPGPSEPTEKEIRYYMKSIGLKRELKLARQGVASRITKLLSSGRQSS